MTVLRCCCLLSCDSTGHSGTLSCLRPRTEEHSHSLPRTQNVKKTGQAMWTFNDRKVPTFNFGWLFLSYGHSSVFDWKVDWCWCGIYLILPQSNILLFTENCRTLLLDGCFENHSEEIVCRFPCNQHSSLSPLTVLHLTLSQWRTPYLWIMTVLTFRSGFKFGKQKDSLKMFKGRLQGRLTWRMRREQVLSQQFILWLLRSLKPDLYLCQKNWY